MVRDCVAHAVGERERDVVAVPENEGVSRGDAEPLMDGVSLGVALVAVSVSVALHVPMRLRVAVSVGAVLAVRVSVLLVPEAEVEGV